MSSITEYIQSNRERFIEELSEFVKIPSVSAKREHKADCERAAGFLAAEFERLGFETRVCPTAGNPVVLAKRKAGAEGRPTLLVYGHYDVQPPEPLELWDAPPFEPRIANGNLYARGATDDKGQSYAHIKAAEALIETEGELPVNLIYLIEGEEEIASDTLERWIRENKDEVRCDAAVISDTSQFAPGQPAICYGLRGIAAIEIRVEASASDLHSGVFGGATPNPANVLCEIVAQLKDSRGRVNIPGFYDDVLPLEAWEREAFAALPWDDDSFKQDLGLYGLHGEEGYSPIEQRWARPTLDVNGIFGGYSGEGSQTIIPAWAGAKITMRLVANQDAKKIIQLFREHVQSIAPPYVQLSFIGGEGNGPVLVPRDARFMDEAVRAFETGFGQTPVFIREGGSIPVVLAITRELGIHVNLMGFGRPDDNLHAPNEKFNLDDFIRGIHTAACFYREAANG